MEEREGMILDEQLAGVRPADVDPAFHDRKENGRLERLVLANDMDVINNYSYCFIPPEDGTYILSSQGSTKELDLYGYLFDSRENPLAGSDNSGEEDFNFSIMCRGMEAGETYYLVIGVKGERSEEEGAKQAAGFKVKAVRPSQDETVISEAESETAARQSETQETETEQAETWQTETESSKAIQSETQETETEQSEAAQTETEQSEAAQTETEQAETWQTETESGKAIQSETQQTETEQSETAQSETQKSETRQGETTQGGIRQSETQQTETNTEETFTEKETPGEPDTDLPEERESGPILIMETDRPGEMETEPITEIRTDPPAIAGIAKALPEIGLGFAAGLAAALVIARLTRAGRKTSKTETEEKEPKKQVILLEDEPKVSEAGSSIGKAHGIGKRRDQQDSFYASELADVKNGASGDMLAIVADGIGGLKNGAVVSSNVVRICTEVFYQNIETMEPGDVLLKMARSVKEEVSRLQRNPEESGSTMVIGVIWKGILYFLTVGDSRIWLWRNGGLIQLNRDHIYQEELALKVINYQDGIQSVKLDHQRKHVTSFIGQGTIKHIDRNPEGIVLQKGDKVLLASDGVFGTIDERSLERMLYQTAENAAKSIQEAVEQKNRAGQDNYTAVILEYQEG